MSTWCAEFELAGDAPVRSLTPWAGEPHARVLVRLHGEPLGYLTVPAASLEPAGLVREARERFSDRIVAHLTAEGIDGPPYPFPGPECPEAVAPEEAVTVVVCTRNRAEQLAGCLERLRALTYPQLEIVVVDNAPVDDSTRQAVAAVAAGDPRFRYVAEPRPGLSCARNRGLAEARGTLLAYTDDDVAVDPRWVHGLVKGFRSAPDVGCVTGLVATAAISGAAEEYFDARAASWSSRVAPQRFALDDAAAQDPLFPYSPGIFGTGANVAFDRAFLAGLGGFDEALGAGTRTRGGEDLDIFVRVLRGRRSIAYEPAALVWHHHRGDARDLLDQLYGYGTGLAAFMTKCLLQPDTRREVLRRVPLGVRRIAGIRTATQDRLTSDVAAPRGALLRELLGMAAGPVLYLRARRDARGAMPR